MSAKFLTVNLILVAILGIFFPSAATLFAAEDKVVATVKDEPISQSEVAAHMADAQLSREEALTNLIELKQLRMLATEKGINIPSGKLNTEERKKLEATLVKQLELPIPSHVGDMVVDHAFIKLPADEQGQKEGLALMEKLRVMVDTGATIPEAFNRLQVDGSNWHIGDHEEYPVTVMPEELRSLPPGGLSSILTFGEGYNLFKLYERKIPAEEIRQAVRIYLIENNWLDLVNIVGE